MDLASREARVIRTQLGGLITSDDPLLLIGQGHPAEQCFALPISPEQLVVSAPLKYFAILGSEATGADVDVLNLWQCRQAREYVITRDRPADPKRYQSQMRPKPITATSGAQFLDLRRQRGRVILNFVSINPGGPDGMPSFLGLRE